MQAVRALAVVDAVVVALRRLRYLLEGPVLRIECDQHKLGQGCLHVGRLTINTLLLHSSRRPPVPGGASELLDSIIFIWERVEGHRRAELGYIFYVNSVVFFGIVVVRGGRAGRKGGGDGRSEEAHQHEDGDVDGHVRAAGLGDSSCRAAAAITIASAIRVR